MQVANDFLLKLGHDLCYCRATPLNQEAWIAARSASKGHSCRRAKLNTPAMASSLTDHVWTIKELIEKAAA